MMASARCAMSTTRSLSTWVREPVPPLSLKGDAFPAWDLVKGNAGRLGGLSIYGDAGLEFVTDPATTIGTAIAAAMPAYVKPG